MGLGRKQEKIVDNSLIDDKNIFPIELNTMPGWAGSSWYFLRYMDPKNNKCFADSSLLKYWGEVDLYVGGSEHATGHLIYSRFWNKFLKDLQYIDQEEPFRKLINQGMILGQSAFVYRIKQTNIFISYGLKSKEDVTPIHIDIKLLKDNSNELDIEKFKNWREEYKNVDFILEDEKYICGREIEKMSKSKFNVLNPDDICNEYGADTLRMYEMFLGPLEQSKPWNTQGIIGVHNFLRKFWKLYHAGENESFYLSDEKATKEELKILHQLIKKIIDDINVFSFNTSVSAFMIAVNSLQKLETKKREILEPLILLISPYSPHIAEELWEKSGHQESLAYIPFPIFNPSYLEEDNFEYPVSFNGKVRFKIEAPTNYSVEELNEIIINHEKTIQYLNNNKIKKIIIIPKKIINIVF